MCVAFVHPLSTFAHSSVLTGVQSSGRRPPYPLVCWQFIPAGVSVSSVSHGLTTLLFPDRCIYFLDPDTILPPSAIRPPAPLLPRSHTNSVSQPEAEPVILEPPVTTNPLLRRLVLPQAEINVIRTLSSRVNVLPVIARADSLTTDRLTAIKLAIRRDLAEAGIGFGIFDLDAHPTSNGDSKAFNGLSNGSSSSPSSSSPTSPVTAPFLRLPYALISPDCYSHSDGVHRQALSRHELVLQYSPTRPLSPNAPSTKLVRGKYTRNYRWGFLDVLDPNHSDFLSLRQAIYHHMQVSVVFNLIRSSDLIIVRFRRCRSILAIICMTNSGWNT
jgi:Septin